MAGQSELLLTTSIYLESMWRRVSWETTGSGAPMPTPKISVEAGRKRMDRKQKRVLSAYGREGP